jgi:hypothetical protein
MSRSESDQSDLATTIMKLRNSSIPEYLKKMTLNSYYGNLSQVVLFPKWEHINSMYGNFYHIRSQEIMLWIESQPIDMWGYYGTKDDPDSWALIAGKSYTFTPEMEAWFSLRWQ